MNRGRVRQGIAAPLIAVETTQKFGEDAIPGRLTDNTLISLETAKEKSLEIFGKVWKSLEFPWNFFGKVWKSLKKLGVAPTEYATP